MWSFFQFLNDDCTLSILDIGAAMTDVPSYQKLIDIKRARLIGFEPDAEECRRLNESYGKPHRFLPYFVGDGRPAIFHETNWGPTGSLFEPNTPLLEKFHHLAELTVPVAQHPITTMRIDDIAEVGDVDYIKIDAQGSELAIFRNASRVLADALLIQTEVCFLELYKNQPMFSDIDSFLRANGFQFHDFLGMGSRSFKPVMSPHHPFIGFRQRVWADAYYVKDWMEWDALSPVKLKRLAALLHDIVESYDLAYLALEALDRQLGSEIAPRYMRRLLEGGHCSVDDRDGFLSHSAVGDSETVGEEGRKSSFPASAEHCLPDGKVRRVLNVGGNSKEIPLPLQYEGWQQVLLDIDPDCKPDVVCDARELTALPGAEYDSVYCSHNLEHYYRHDVSRVLSGFIHVLKDDGFVFIRVPDMAWLMQTVVQNGLDMDDVLYQSQAGPITVRDVVYGFGIEIERSGSDFFAHKTGFSQQSLISMLKTAGFPLVFSSCGNREITAYAFKNAPTSYAARLLNLPGSADGGEQIGNRLTAADSGLVSMRDNEASETQTNEPHPRIGSSRRLHIGGQEKSDGWEILNVNAAPCVDHVCNANDLSRFADGTFSEIYASHVVEHLDYKGELTDTLREWKRVLEPGGRVMISVPDLDALAELLVSKVRLTVDERFFVMRMMFGGHIDKHDYHLVGLNQEFLTRFLGESGYANIRRVNEFGLFDDASSMAFNGVGISLNMIAEKRQRAESTEGLASAEAIDRRAGIAENGDGLGHARAAEDAIVVRTADGISISVPATLSCITTYVLLEQERWFEREVGFVLRWLEQGMNAIDVGANVGVYCLPMARAVGEAGQVIAFEPDGRNRKHLEASRIVNDLGNLAISVCALADAEQVGSLQIAKSGELNSLSEGAAHSANSERVRVSTLDFHEQECRWPSIDFVRIDAEGQETRIVAGGRAFFVRHSPLVMYEFNHAGVSNKALRGMFAALGYQTYRLLGDASCLVPVASDEQYDLFERNLFAAKPDRAASLAEKELLVSESVALVLSDSERSQALEGMLDQLYARSFEFSAVDVLDCPYGEAIIMYAAYRFLGFAPARRLAALHAAFEILESCCQETPTPTGLATLARVALDLGRRSTAVDALKQLVREKGVVLDQPFFPPCARYESISPENREADWFVAASHEQFEMSGSYSSYFASSDLAWVKWLCESPFASAEISRRMVLRAAEMGMASRDLAACLRSDHTHANPAYWTAAGISLIQSLL